MTTANCQTQVRLVKSIWELSPLEAAAVRRRAEKRSVVMFDAGQGPTELSGSRLAIRTQKGETVDDLLSRACGVGGVTSSDLRSLVEATEEAEATKAPESGNLRAAVRLVKAQLDKQLLWAVSEADRRRGVPVRTATEVRKIADCRHCGGAFVAQRTNARFCGRSCIEKAARRRKSGITIGHNDALAAPIGSQIR